MRKFEIFKFIENKLFYKLQKNNQLFSKKAP